MFSLSEYIYTQTNPKSGLIEKKKLTICITRYFSIYRVLNGPSDPLESRPPPPPCSRLSSRAILAETLALFVISAMFDLIDLPPVSWLILSSKKGVTFLPLIPSRSASHSDSRIASSISLASAAYSSGMGTPK